MHGLSKILRYLGFLFILISPLSFVWASVPEEDEGMMPRGEDEYIFPEVVAYIDGMEITKDSLQSFVALTQQFEVDSVVHEAVARQLVTDYGSYLQLAEAAKSIGLDQKKVFRDRLKYIELLMLAEEYYRDQTHKDPVLLTKIEAYYLEHKNSPEAQEYELYQIAFNAQDEALKTFKQISNGQKNFLELLADARKDESKRDLVKDIGWVNLREQPRFSAVVSLDVGDILPQMIVTNYGYHIVYLHDQRAQAFIPFSELREEEREGYISNYYYDVFLPETRVNMVFELEKSL